MADRKKLEELIARINRTSNADFVKRLLDENRKILKNDDGTVSTHELGYVTEDGGAVVFPSIQSVGDSLARFPYPESYERAVEKGDTVHMSIPDAELFTTGYKDYYPGFDKYSDGGSIHIKPSHRGRLTELKERTGKTEAELYSDGNPAHKKMVVFARNSRKWSHADGGFLTDYPDSGTIIPVMPGNYTGGVAADDGGGSRGVEPAIDFAGMKLRQRYAESGFKDNLTSSAGAIGRYQIMPITYKEYTQRTGKTGDLLDPVFNEGLRDWYMDENLPKYNAVKRGNPSDLVREYRKYAAYNMGPGALNKALSKAEADGIDIDNSTLWLKYLPKETRDYVNFIVGGEDVPDTAKTQALYDAAVKKYGIQMSCGGKIHKFDAGGFVEKYGAAAVKAALKKVHRFDGESEKSQKMQIGGYDSDESERKFVHKRWDPTLGFDLLGAVGNIIQGGNKSGGDENEYWKAYMGLSNHVPTMSKQARTEWDDAVEAKKEEKGELRSDFYGTTPRMDQMIQVIADTLHTGNLLRNYKEAKKAVPELAPKHVIRSLYEQGKKVMENPGKWTQITEDNGQLRLYDVQDSGEQMPLGMLANFGMKWLPEENKIMVHDTYDFPWYARLFGGIPKRPKEMKIRGIVKYDPLKGSVLLRDGLDVSKLEKHVNKK